jgi:hypothetical protein
MPDEIIMDRLRLIIESIDLSVTKIEQSYSFSSRD